MESRTKSMGLDHSVAAVSELEEKIFEEDELDFRRVDQRWLPEFLLQSKGIYFLKDVAKKLDLNSAKVIRKAREIERSGDSSWEVMGLRKIWKTWAVRMVVFGPYYEKHFKPKYSKVAPGWDCNMLLKQKGIFLLTDVCRHIPFSPIQIRHQATKRNNSEVEIGVWKDEGIGRLVVRMEVFSKWVIQVWRNNGLSSENSFAYKNPTEETRVLEKSSV